MTFAEFSIYAAQPDHILLDPMITVRDLDDICVVNDWFPLPLAGVSSGIAARVSHAVVDSGQNPLGDVLTCVGEEYRPSEFSAQYLAAYLADVQPAEYGQPGFFKRNYFVCSSGRLEEYRREYLHSAAIWGGFSHLEAPSAAAPLAPRAALPITAAQGIVLPTDMHREAMSRSVIQPHAFERFLKLYHLLELSFDYQLVEKIRNLGSDLRGVGELLNKYERAEVDRLKDVISSCVEPGAVAECIRLLCGNPQWHRQIEIIFFDYGKGSFPLHAKRTSFEDLLRTAQFTESEAVARNFCDRNTNPTVQTENFHKLTLSLATYWIYRIRCCIAHSRIGEYVMRLTDEPFVEQFGEALLRCVLKTVLV